MILSVFNRKAIFHKRLETSFFDKCFRKRRQIMPKNHACEEKWSKCTKELTLSNNCTFFRSSTIIFQLKIEDDVWQPIFN